VVPGILLMTTASGSISTAVSVCMDMTEGIVARFRTMAISRASLLTGHVVGSLILTVLSLVVVLGVALLMGFRSGAGPAEWAAAAGLLVLLTLALTWLAVAFGLVADRPETASNLPLPLALLPFIGSGFVPTRSMPVGVRQFAEYQPFTPITETLRGLLTGTPIGHSGVIAVAWCAGIGLAGYLWSRSLFGRKTGR
jgi:ABC-2 type transport system permease protein